MPRRLSSQLFRLNRNFDDIEAVEHPRRAPRRFKNVLLGKALGRAGLGHALWGPSRRR
jgi:hypothetical protein